MTKVGYRATGNCDALDSFGWTGYNANGAEDNKRALFCVRTMEKTYSTGTDICPQFPRSAYYQVKVFFALDVPIINNVFKFQLTGTTRKLFYPSTMEGNGKCG